MTSIGFVSTSILESSDGIDFNAEKRLESDEVRAAEKRAEQLQNRPLWEQLADRQDAKQAEYDANTKLIFAPPKALDEDEAGYLEGVEEQRRVAKEKAREWEDKEIEAFALARANQTIAALAPRAPPKPAALRPFGDAQPKKPAVIQPVLNIKPKPKVIKEKRKHKATHDVAATDEKRLKATPAADKGITAKASSPPQALGSLVGAYASDSDGDNT